MTDRAYAILLLPVLVVAIVANVAMYITTQYVWQVPFDLLLTGGWMFFGYPVVRTVITGRM